MEKALYHTGDLMIGVIADINGIVTREHIYDILSRDKPLTFDQKPTEKKGILLYTVKYQKVAILLFAINEINENPALLPNISLGLYVYESFLDEAKTLDSYMRILTGNGLLLPNYRCTNKELVAVITSASSRLSILLANMFGMYGFPQISYGSTDPELSDKAKFPYFYRTVPNEKYLCVALSLLLKYFGWTWIGIIYSDEESNESIVKTFAATIMKDGVCIEFMEKFTIHAMYVSAESKQMLKKVERYSATVIVFWANLEFTYNLWFLVRNLTPLKKMWLLITDTEYIIMSRANKKDLSPFTGSLRFEISKPEIPGLISFLGNLTLDHYPQCQFTDVFKFLTNQCKNKTNTTMCEQNNQKQLLFETISSAGYRIYIALYSLAYAIQDLMVSRCQKGKISQKETVTSALTHFHPSELHRFLKKVNFINNAGENIYFDNNGDVAPTYDLLNWMDYMNKSFTGISVGKASFEKGEKLYVNDSAIVWPENFHQVTPRSVCSEGCPVGYRKSVLSGKPHCCYICIQCPRGEITSHNNTDNCWKCPDDMWPNKRKDMCVSKPMTFLSYQDLLGVLIAATSVFLCLTALLTLAAFIYHQNTSIVKANNKSLTFLLLVSLSITLLWCLAFVGRPGTVTCLLRQAIFGICFTVSVSSLLAKTVIVLMAFHAIKPGSKLRRYMGQSIPHSIIILCSALQILLCISWIVISPPTPFHDFQTEPDQVIIGCKEGIGLYVILSFIGCLAMGSLVIAYLARRLPDAYNEAKFITFSMIIFFSVWISFIPAYLSSKGKYTEAVEVFAILASSAGILACIFFPKCYVIFYRPDQAMNINITRSHPRKISQTRH